MNKPFDSNLYQEYDRKAKEATKKLYGSLGLNLVDNINPYGVDLNCYSPSNTILFNVECEVKTAWKGASFPFNTIQIPCRKAKFVNQEAPTFFIVFNESLSRYACIPGTILENCNRIEVPNRFMPDGEFFFQVPVSDVKIGDT